MKTKLLLLLGLFLIFTSCDKDPHTKEDYKKGLKHANVEIDELEEYNDALEKEVSHLMEVINGRFIMAEAPRVDLDSIYKEKLIQWMDEHDSLQTNYPDFWRIAEFVRDSAIVYQICLDDRDPREVEIDFLFEDTLYFIIPIQKYKESFTIVPLLSAPFGGFYGVSLQKIVGDEKILDIGEVDFQLSNVEHCRVLHSWCYRFGQWYPPGTEWAQPMDVPWEMYAKFKRI